MARDRDLAPPAPAEAPVFYFDLASPYAYLASGQVDEAFGPAVRWQPILVGALHKHYRRLSWGTTPAKRSEGMDVIERRAAHLDVRLRWPDPYPANTLLAMRAAIWAALRGRTRAFAAAAFSLAFVEGRDLTLRSTVLEAAEQVGLDASALDRALGQAAIKAELRAANDRAIVLGVYGVPTFDVAGLLWWGEDRLSEAKMAWDAVSAAR